MVKMNNLKRYYIEKVSTNIKKLKKEGIYFSGIKGEGEYKDWWINGQLSIHYFLKDGKYEGEYKEWMLKGRLREHSFYRDGVKINMPSNTKDGYILAGKKYYKD